MQEDYQLKEKKSMAVICASTVREAEAKKLAAQLQLPFHTAAKDVAGVDYYLVLSDAHLALQKTGPTAPGPLWVDFVQGANDYRRRHGGGRQQALARAVGLKSKTGLSVIDATAGLGRDAFVLASLGCDVLLIERDPIIGALLADGLSRARDSEATAMIAARMRYQQADAATVLAALLEQARPDVVYLDPMYPVHHKAQVKKDMQLLRELIKTDPAEAKLLALALEKATQRVVVKRMHAAPPLGNQKPDRVMSLRRHRFDIYLTA